MLVSYHIASRFFAYVTSSGTPESLSMHSAVAVDNNTLLVYGGNLHHHYTTDICYSPNLYAYTVNSRRWRTLTTTKLGGEKKKKKK